MNFTLLRKGVSQFTRRHCVSESKARVHRNNLGETASWQSYRCTAGPLYLLQFAQRLSAFRDERRPAVDEARIKLHQRRARGQLRARVGT